MFFLHHVVVFFIEVIDLLAVGVARIFNVIEGLKEDSVEGRAGRERKKGKEEGREGEEGKKERNKRRKWRKRKKEKKEMKEMKEKMRGKGAVLADGEKKMK
jgi:hypothetical protein